MGRVNPERTAVRPDWHTDGTLADLKRAGFTLRAWCSRCGHARPIDIEHLIDTRGAEATSWDRWVICGAYDCRGRAVFSASSNRHNFYRLTRDWT